MKKRSYSYDQLNRLLRLHYIRHPDGGFKGDDADQALQRMAAQRLGIQDGIKYSWIRRTHHGEYVSSGSRIIKHVTTHKQIGGRFKQCDESFYCDDHGDDRVIPFVIQLPARRNHQGIRFEVWIYGYKYSNWEDATIFLNSYATKDDAMRAARREAESHAQSCYEEWQKDQHEQRILGIREDLVNIRKKVAALVAAYREVSLEMLQDRYREMICDQWELRRKLHKELKTLDV